MSPADVRAARERLGMTTQQLAEALECTVRTVQFWESGERNVPGPARVAMRLMLHAPKPGSRGRSVRGFEAPKSCLAL